MDVMCLKFTFRMVLKSFLETLSLAIPGTGGKSKSVSATGFQRYPQRTESELYRANRTLFGTNSKAALRECPF